MSYAEGDWFGVPLRNGRFATGVVARANANGVLFGYFFGPRRLIPPTLRDVEVYRPEFAVLVRKFGDAGLRRGSWPVAGRLPNWNRAEWRMPVFARFEELTGRYLQVVYDPEDPNRHIRDVQVDAKTAAQHPKDGLLGAGAVERVLTGLLAVPSRDIRAR